MEGAPRPPRRRLGRWRRRASVCAPERTNEAQFARDRAYRDEGAPPFVGPDYPFPPRARILVGILAMAAIAVAVIVTTFRLFPPVVGLLLTLSASALVVGWSRSHRAEAPLYLARRRAAATRTEVHDPATPQP